MNEQKLTVEERERYSLLTETEQEVFDSQEERILELEWELQEFADMETRVGEFIRKKANLIDDLIDSLVAYSEDLSDAQKGVLRDINDTTREVYEAI